jgi:hypothetical protein
MPRATDLRYGRRGGGWVPEARKRETLHPHRSRLEPCPSQGCTGEVSVPMPRPNTPYVITCRGGMFVHTFDVTPLDALLATTTTPPP